MKLLIQILIILLFVTFVQSMGLAEEKKNKSDSNIITTKDICSLTYCYDDLDNPVPKTSLNNFCIDGEVIKPGQKITVLGIPLYFAETGEQVHIENIISIRAGTRLSKVKKPINIESHSVCVLNKSVKNYNKLVLNVVKDPNKINEIKKNLSNIDSKTHFIQKLQIDIEANCYMFEKGKFPKIFEGEPTIYEFPSISKTTFLIQDSIYDQMVLLKNTDCTLLTHPGYGSTVEMLFRVNNQYFLKINYCQYETDNCSTFYHEIN